jgi:hypothetical protein
VRQIGQSGIGAQKSQHGSNPFFGACDGAVDAFVGQQQSALHSVGFAAGLQWGLQIGEIWQINELVEGSGEKKRIGLHGADYPSLLKRLDL